ncbi:CoA pyrophosphatase [Pontivivens nitratireducens]|uniref:CoA pyrophosphatase n=1 Tax=Pontivivens nitratireducens TaxID=2758038 RepID=UPI00163B6084|nr:CoA pyrophosphatase [Pontibrevibacter nitratireducens]
MEQADQANRELEQVRRALARGIPADSSDFDLNAQFRAALPEGRTLRPAAVLCPLVVRGGRVRVILTRRSSQLRHHPGQVAFPGGKVDAGDDGPLAAALREASEEIGLAPSQVELFGELPQHETVTGFRMHPYIGLVAPDFTPRSDPGEVEEVFEVPLAHLVDPARCQVHTRQWRGHGRSYYAMPYGPYYIWGATARILKALSDMVNATDI